jgi:hypothetical protein
LGEIGSEVVYWILVAQNRGQCRAVMDTLMNLVVP